LTILLLVVALFIAMIKVRKWKDDEEYRLAEKIGAEEDSKIPLGKLLKNLEHDKPRVRRHAWLILGQRDPNIIPAMIDLLKTKPNNYRIKFGVIYTLRRMYMFNKKSRDNIFSFFKKEDIVLLLGYTEDKSSAIKNFSTEFLPLSRDPKILKHLEEIAKSNENEIIVNNAKNIINKIKSPSSTKK